MTSAASAMSNEQNIIKLPQMHFHICFSFKLWSPWSSLNWYIVPHIVLLCHPASHTQITQDKVLHLQYNDVFCNPVGKLLASIGNSEQKYTSLQRLPEWMKSGLFSVPYLTVRNNELSCTTNNKNRLDFGHLCNSSGENAKAYGLSGFTLWFEFG